MLGRICAVQIQPRKHELDHTDPGRSNQTDQGSITSEEAQIMIASVETGNKHITADVFRTYFVNTRNLSPNHHLPSERIIKK